MRTKLAILMVVLLGLSGLLQATPVPIVQFDFNTADGTATTDSVGSVGGLTGAFSGTGGFYQNNVNHAPSDGPETQMMYSAGTGSTDGFSFNNVANGLTAMTVSGWISTSELTSPSTRIASNGGYSSTIGGFDFNLNNGYLLFKINGVSGASGSGIKLPSDEWVYFAAAYDSAAGGTLDYYLIDSEGNVQTSSTTLDGGTVSSTASKIWLGRIDGGSSSHSLRGYYDNFRIYDAKLTQAEVLEASSFNDIPEPATIGLLSIGGIFTLIRRKK